MNKLERQKIKDFIYNILIIFQNQNEFLADDSGFSNYENPMFQKAMLYILGVKNEPKTPNSNL